MSLPMQHIIQHLFNTASLSGVPREQLSALVEEYPSFGVAHYLLSRKLQAEGDEHFSEETLKTNLYFSNPYWLQWLLKNNGEELGSVEDRVRTSDLEKGTATEGMTGAEEEGIRAEGWSKEAEEMMGTVEGSAHGAEEMTEGSKTAVDIPASEGPVSEPLYGSAEEARAAAEEIRVHGDEVMRTEGALEEVVTEGPEAAFDETATIDGQEAEVSKEWLMSETEEVLRLESPSAADQLLESIAALRLSHQQVAEDAAPVPEEPAPAISIAAMTLEQADDQSVEDIDGTPPLPEDSEESAGAVLAAAAEQSAAPVTPADQPVAHADQPVAPADQPVTSPDQPDAHAAQSVASAAPVQDPANRPEAGPVLTPILEPVVAFEPFHTIDYFASQGIRLTLDENPSDKLGKQLKSFTDWLKVMRKLPQQKNSQIVPDIAAEHQVRAIAAHSIEGKDVVTETMAEVLVKQGMREKAMEVYRKLSLLDPDKSAYFANKIEELKID